MPSTSTKTASCTGSTLKRFNSKMRRNVRKTPRDASPPAPTSTDWYLYLLASPVSADQGCRAALRLVRARVPYQMRAPLQTYNQLTDQLLFGAFWFHRAVTLARPNTILNRSVYQSELLQILSLPSIAGPQKVQHPLNAPLMRPWEFLDNHTVRYRLTLYAFN